MPQKQNVNITWIGKPRTLHLDQPLHDLMGPFEMMERTDLEAVEFNFWCLDEHVEHYKNLLKDKPGISVYSVEKYIDEKSLSDNVTDEEKILIQRTQKLLDKILKGEDRAQIRDLFTTKEVSVFALSALMGGYFFDSNVVSFADRLEFPDYPNNKMPALFSPVKTHLDADVWMIYASKENRMHSLKAWTYFLDQVEEINERFKPVAPYSDEYLAEMLHVVIKASLLLENTERNIDHWKAESLGAGYPVKLTEQPLAFKLYFNTHGAKDREAQSALMKAVVLGNIAEVSKLLDEGMEINKIIETGRYRNITPYNSAEFYGYKEIAQLLLQRGADERIKLESKVNPVRCGASFYVVKSEQSIDATSEGFCVVR
ncbi:MAG: hypothetical protein NTU49_11100 [Gammaproteobacteria bacterium]|nr:hypothetical protein [Gammaproteobacteria bacterium]